MKKNFWRELADRWLCGWFLTIAFADVAGLVVIMLAIFGVVR